MKISYQHWAECSKETTRKGRMIGSKVRKTGGVNRVKKGVKRRKASMWEIGLETLLVASGVDWRNI